MISNNQYIKMTKSHLRNYTYYVQAAKNIESDILDINNELNDVSVKITNYGVHEGSSSSELSEVERMADRIIKLKEQRKLLQQELQTLKKRINRLEQMVGMLPDDEQQSIRMFFFQRYHYELICSHLYLSERCIRNKINNGVKGVAIMLFGSKAAEGF